MNKPRQSEKKTEEFDINTAKYYFELVDFNSGYYRELDLLYKAYYGELVGDDYGKVLNPFNTEDVKYKKFPATLKNYNILKPVIKARLGESSKRFTSLQVVNINDFENDILEENNKIVDGILAQKAINIMNKFGMNTGMESIQTPEDINKLLKNPDSNFREKHSIYGQEALDYIRHFEDLDDKFQELKEHFLIGGIVVTYKEVENEEVKYNVVHPMDFWVMDGSSKYIEDREACIRRERKTLSEVIDDFRYRGLLKESFITVLEDIIKNESLSSTDPNLVSLDLNENFESYQKSLSIDGEGFIWVYTLEWKTLVNVYFVTYVNEQGFIEEKEFESKEEFEGLNVLNVEKETINKVRSIYRFGEKEYSKGFWISPERTEISNSSRCKLRFNGLVNKSYLNCVESYIKDGLPYQVLFNIYNYNLELLVNKNKGKFTLFPIGILPKQYGSDPMTAFMYYITSTSIGFYDESKPNALQALQYLKSIDISLWEQIQYMYNLLNEVRMGWWEVAGFNRQRYGQTMASDGKAVNEQALLRSSIITAEEDRKFDKFIECDSQGLLDFSKYAWLNGKKAVFKRSDDSLVFLNIDAEKHMNADYGVFVKLSAEEQSKVDMLKEIGKLLAQNKSIDPTIIAEIIDQNNFDKIKNIMQSYTNKMREYEQSLEQQRNEAVVEAQRLKEEGEDKNREAEIYMAELDYQKGIETALINSASSVLGYDQGENGEQDLTKITELAEKVNNNSKTNLLNLRKQIFDEKTKKKELDLQEKKIDTDLKIARTNKNKYDK